MARGVIPQALCSAGLPRSPVPNTVGIDVAPSDPGAVACAATPPSSSTRRDLVIRFQAGAHHQQIAARRMWLSTPQGPTAINFDLAPPLSSSGVDARPSRHQQTKKPAMSSHGRSHHSLSATQGARIRVERVIASISDCLRRLSGRPREASPNCRGPGTKKTGHRLSWPVAPLAPRRPRCPNQGRRINASIFSSARLAHTCTLKGHLHAQIAQSKQARDTKKPTTSFTWPVAPLARRYPRCPDKGKRIIASIFSCSRRAGVRFAILSSLQPTLSRTSAWQACTGTSLFRVNRPYPSRQIHCTQSLSLVRFATQSESSALHTGKNCC